MARNRKNESAAARFAPALKALLLCAFFIAAGVGYVWYKNQTKVLGDEMRACEARLYNLRLNNAMLQNRLNTLRLPATLEARVKQANLGLVPSVPQQVIHVTETVPEPMSSAEAAFAEHRQARTGFMERDN